MIDKFADGTPSIIQCLRPKGPGWTEIDGNFRQITQLSGVVKAYFHKRSMIAVFSAVERAEDAACDGPEYHLSISRQTPSGPQRVDSNDARWVVSVFGADGAREDNHVPFGRVRNFWRPVAGDWVGVHCHCEDDEPAIRENKGDYVWRGITE